MFDEIRDEPVNVMCDKCASTSDVRGAIVKRCYHRAIDCRVLGLCTSCGSVER
jgi:uncharacterized Zn finger protein